jgi:hypothetical protein
LTFTYPLSVFAGGLRNKVIEEVKSKFDAWFGSHTEAAIKGDWRLPDGTIAREPVSSS